MGNRELAGKLLLAVATAGLTTCDGVGAVDPAPEPMKCEDYDKGQSITITGSLTDAKLAMTMDPYPWAEAPTVTAQSGLTIDSVTLGAEHFLEIAATLDAGATTASFTVAGNVTDGEVTCPSTRTFTVTVTGTDVEVAESFRLPLSPRRHASIELLRREGLEVELRATGSLRGTTVTWTPTGGEIETAAGRTRWTLPSEPGVYQVEMLVDRGDDGFSHDTLTIEVLG